MKPYVLGLIPARGGSKSVPRKNIRSLGGRPMIVYSIEQALRSKMLSRVVTSTEDPEIARIAAEAGSDVIERPAELARDETPMLPVIQHAVQRVEEEGTRVDIIVLLQPTVPFRTAEDIDAAMEKLLTSSADSVVSLCRVYDFHPVRMKKIIDDWIVPYCEPEVEGTRRQDLPPAYHRNGAVYAVRRDVVMRQDSILGAASRPYLMPPERSINIDEERDFLFAEAVLAEMRLGCPKAVDSIAAMERR